MFLTYDRRENATGLNMLCDVSTFTLYPMPIENKQTISNTNPGPMLEMVTEKKLRKMKMINIFSIV